MTNVDGMKNPLVTVALSAYNVGEYLDEALACINRQTFTDIEILCIDDASVDDTYERIQRHAHSDGRYRVIRQARNQGLSVSRNLAISEARGKYIIMLDGDDLFDETMVEQAVNEAQRTDADMVMWDYIPFTAVNQLSNKRASDLLSIDVNDKIALLQRPAFMWVRLLKVDKLKEMDVRFEPGLTKQDIPIHWRLVTNFDKIALLPRRLSFYRIQPNATSYRKDRSVFSLAKVMDIVGNDLRDAGLYERYKSEYLRSRLSLLHGMYDFIKPELKAEAAEMIRERLDDDARAYLNGKNALGLRANAFYGKMFGNLPDTLLYNTILCLRAIYRFLKR